MKYVDCLALGDAIYDISVYSNLKNVVHGGTINAPVVINPGGVANIAAGVQRLGGTSAFCGIVGKDAFGDLYLQDLRVNGIHPLLFRMQAKSTGTLVSIVSTSGERSFLVSRGANDFLEKAHVDWALREVRPKVLYLSGHSLATKKVGEVLKYAVHKGARGATKVIFDCTPFNLIQREQRRYHDLTNYAYCLCLNAMEARALTGKKDIREIVQILRTKVELVALKLGKRGCVIASPSEITKVKPPITKVVDSTGAGDAFAAALAYGIAHGLDQTSMAELATNFSAIKVQIRGPRIPINTTIKVT